LAKFDAVQDEDTRSALGIGLVRDLVRPFDGVPEVGPFIFVDILPAEVGSDAQMVLEPALAEVMIDLER
jgi:hypothetical protein